MIHTRPSMPIIALAAFLFLLGATIFERAHGAESPAKIAQGLTTVCAQAAGDHSPCYEREVPLLYPKLSVSRLFDVVRVIRKADPSYQFCHVLAHKVGERVVAEDPARWVEAIPLNPADGLCSNGYIHGVIGGRFRAEVLDTPTIEKLIPDFTRACAPREGWIPSDLDRAICYHGMGHLYDFITNADLPKALDLCRRTAPENSRRVCVEGVFMQIYQPLEPDDFQLIEQMRTRPTPNTVRPFCATFKDPEHVGACLRESWPFFKEGIMQGTGVGAFCSSQPGVELEDHCYRAAFTIIGRLSLGEPEAAAHACRKSPPARQEMCYSVIAQSVLEEDRTNAKGALALCAKAPREIAEACAAWLVSQARFIYGSNRAEYNRFCEALPAPLMQSCLDNESHRKPF